MTTSNNIRRESSQPLSVTEAVHVQFSFTVLKKALAWHIYEHYKQIGDPYHWIPKTTFRSLVEDSREQNRISQAIGPLIREGVLEQNPHVDHIRPKNGDIELLRQYALQ